MFRPSVPVVHIFNILAFTASAWTCGLDPSIALTFIGGFSQKENKGTVLKRN